MNCRPQHYGMAQLAQGPVVDPYNTDPSIFGYTERGVPNPFVPHYHPYPTRYHGLMLNAPEFGLPYRERPYYVAKGLGAPVDDAATGVKAMLWIAGGAGLAYLVTKKDNKKIRNAVIGGVATALAGGFGLIGGVIVGVSDV